MDIDAGIYKMNLQGIAPFTDNMSFYYDETGNCRKFYLTESGFNDSNAVYKNFILGGIAFKGTLDETKLKQMFLDLGFVNGEQPELKFKNLYHNSKDFLSFLESKRASVFLSWLDNNEVYIHYLTLNNLYYSLVDIIDSLDSEIIYRCNRELKNALYDFVIDYTNQVIQILYKHRYPDVTNVSEFVDDMVWLIKNNSSSYFLNIICDELNNAKKNNELVFIQNNEPYILISEYYHFYLNRISVFSSSTNTFDEENHVQKKLKNIVLHYKDDVLKNYIFVKSTKCKYIQISDMLVGLLSRLFVFLDTHKENEIIKISNSINDLQLNNFKIIYNLILRSNQKSPLLILNINSNRNMADRERKLEILTHIT